MDTTHPTMLQDSIVLRPTPTQSNQEKQEAYVARFFRAIYPHGSGSGYLNVWAKSSGSHWFDLSQTEAISAAATESMRINERDDCWFMTGLTAANLGTRSKGKESEIIAVPGLHCDIDISHSVHKKAASLPPTEADAHTILAAAPLPPSVIIHSGHGLQAYWLFPEYADTSTPEKAARIKSLLVRWQAHLRHIAEANGWTMDATHNLDRLMRIAGTHNRKADPKPVKMQKSDGPRYSIEELEAALPVIPLESDEIDFTPATPSTPATIKPAATSTATASNVLKDDDIIAAATRAKNGEKFLRCFNGVGAGYASPSEAVQALACMLVFWSTDPAQIERIMCLSPLCSGYEKWNRADIRQRCILKAFATVTTHYTPPAATATATASADTTEKKDSQADALVALAAEAEVYHDAQNVAYATVKVNGHSENHRVKGTAFSGWLREKYYTARDKSPTEKSLVNAIGSIDARALYRGAQHETAIRLGSHGGNVYLDLCNPAWEAIEITPTGWSVVAEPPVRFTRKPGMLAIPTPVHGGSIDLLRPMINAAEDDTWILIVAWLVGSLNPKGPYPIMVVGGEQGSAKSCMCRMLRALVDPNFCDMRSAPTSTRDLAIACKNSRTIGLENISSIPKWLSDDLCCCSTGSAFTNKQNYTDDEENLFSAMRPVIMNGIEDLASRGDLAHRSISLCLATIPDSRRCGEETLAAQFEKARPAILGALLTAVSAALAHPDVTIEGLPRMFDFAKWIIRSESALPWDSGEFLTAYRANINRGQAVAVDSAAIGPVLEKLIDGHHGRWSGTVSELLRILDTLIGGEGWTSSFRRPKDFPQTARGLSGQLRRLAPSLRSAGIEVEFHGHTKTGSMVTFQRSDAESTESPESPLDDWKVPDAE